jgi:hypothetical protein
VQHELTVVLDRCTVSWPQQRWLSFTCPACDASSHVALAGRTVSTGDIDGAPGPCFFEEATVTVPDLRVEISSSAVRVRAGGRAWAFPARD